jgi:N-acetylglucosaminyldiphosphoundecaprenol N-acetyl-beta-D-mannosaminyltransferase
MATAQRPGVRIGQIFIDAITLPRAIDRIEALVQSGQGGAVFTPNVDHVVNAERLAGLREAYAQTALSVADGQPLVWASRLVGQPLPERVPGSDLVPALLNRAAERKLRVYLLGGAPGVAEQCAEHLRRKGVVVAGVDAPYVPAEARPAEDDPIIARVAAARPDLVFVALGSPKQELFIHRARGRVPGAVWLGVGASLDFLIGRVQRAPVWMRDNGLEWLHRLAQEPRRLAWRYFVNDSRFIFVLARTLGSRG